MSTDRRQDLAPGAILSPGRIEYGFGARASLGEFAAESGTESALIVTDADIVDAGVVDPVLETLADAGVSTDVFDGVEPEPRLAIPERAGERLAGGGYDLVVGVGGGSSMDTAKLASVLATQDRPVRDMVGMGNVPGEGLPLVLLPTTAGTGSEVTHIGVFADEEAGGNKVVVYSEHLFADLAVVDPDLTASLPGSVAADTGMDALTHAVESYTTLERTTFTDALAREAIQVIGDALRTAVHQGGANDRARYRMSYAAMVAGLAFVNSGLGAVHALTYPLGVEHHVGHGRANAVLLPHVVEYNLPAEPGRYSDVASLLGVPRVEGQSEMEHAAEAVGAIEALNEDIGIPNRIGDLGGIDREEFSHFADVAFEHSQHNIERNPRDLDHADVVAIFENAY
ncbi:MAG: iron-containing alcohol dehydrogenase [Halanaeroarchaeum sp.]